MNTYIKNVINSFADFEVLSLFDGMSGTQIALDRLGKKISKYHASEVDPKAIQITQKNYPETNQLGDINNWKDWDIDWSKIGLVVGGFPCQSWSVAGKQTGDRDNRGQLFWVMLDIMKHVLDHNPNAKYLMENVRMSNVFEEYITYHTEKALPNVNKYLINSSLVSAQNRKRFYWTNIVLDEPQPKDKGIVLKDILEDYDAIGDELFHSDKAIQYMERGNKKWMQAGDRRADRYTQTPDKEKAFTLTANFHKGVPYNYFDDTRATSNETTGLILEGHATNLNGHDYVKRIYSPDGKAPSLCASSGGNLEPKVSVKGARIVNRRLDENGTRKDNDTSIKPQARIEVRADDISNCLTTVQKDSIVVKNKRWRKLSCTECERLQTVPDGYTAGVSNTQRYRMLGNGFTVSVIEHILKGI